MRNSCSFEDEMVVIGLIGNQGLGLLGRHYVAQLILDSPTSPIHCQCVISRCGSITPDIQY